MNILYRWEMCLLAGSSAVLGDMKKHCYLARLAIQEAIANDRLPRAILAIQEAIANDGLPRRVRLEELQSSSFNPGNWSAQPKHIVGVLLKGLIWGMLCLPCSVMPQGLGFQPLFICLIVAMEIQYLKR